MGLKCQALTRSWTNATLIALAHCDTERRSTVVNKSQTHPLRQISYSSKSREQRLRSNSEECCRWERFRIHIAEFFIFPSCCSGSFSRCITANNENEKWQSQKLQFLFQIRKTSRIQNEKNLTKCVKNIIKRGIRSWLMQTREVIFVAVLCRGILVLLGRRDALLRRAEDLCVFKLGDHLRGGAPPLQSLT